MNELQEFDKGLELEKGWGIKIWRRIKKPIKKPTTKWNTNIRLIITLQEHQINSEIGSPRPGSIERILISTVIPQYDIWPQLRIYPKNPTAQLHPKITQPETQIKEDAATPQWPSAKDKSSTFNLIQAPRIRWIKIKSINKEAPKQCNQRINQPTLTSIII